jgi:hypothetical protein
MSFNLLRTESVSPRVSTSAGTANTSNIVVEFVDSKPQPAAGKKKSRRDQVVIEIDYTPTKPVPQQAPEPVVAATATATRHTEPLKTTVDDRALEIARSFYGSPQAANIRSITTRKELAGLFRNIVGESPVSFAMVLFAMAKGMRVVNVYASGEKLEWRTVAPSSSAGSSASEQPIQKKPSTTATVIAGPGPNKPSSASSANTKKSVVTTDKDGWTTVVKGNAKPKDTSTIVDVAAEKPTPTTIIAPSAAEPVVAEAAPQNDDEMMQKIINDLQTTKNSIRKLEAEIAILVDEHSSIEAQIKSCPIERVVEFHRITITQLEHLLDGMEADRVALVQHRNELCDKLKN